MPQDYTIQFKHQIMWTIVAVFVAMTASIIVSTIVVSQILGKQVAAAQNTAPAVWQVPATQAGYGQELLGCVEQDTTRYHSQTQSAPAEGYGGYGGYGGHGKYTAAPKHYQPAKVVKKHETKKQVSVSNVKNIKSVKNVKNVNNVTKKSYAKTTNINSGNVIGSHNQETNTNVAVTKISDSFNKDSYNSVENNTTVVNKDSFNTSVTKDSYNTSVEVKETNINSKNKTNDSYNDNSKTTTNTAVNSFNDNSKKVKVEDSFNDNSKNVNLIPFGPPVALAEEV